MRAIIARTGQGARPRHRPARRELRWDTRELRNRMIKPMPCPPSSRLARRNMTPVALAVVHGRDKPVYGEKPSRRRSCGNHTGNWYTINYITIRYILSLVAARYSFGVAEMLAKSVPKRRGR